MTTIFERLESNVRSYCRSFPTVFSRALNARLWDEDGREYIDFLAGAGTLNYGHNPPGIRKRLISYLHDEGLVHGLDMHTRAKQEFLERFEACILNDLEANYKVQFTGPTGTNAVEAALKLARRVTGRANIVAFTNGFHGVSLGSVAVTGNSHFRDAVGVPLGNATFMPYDGYLGPEVDTLSVLDQFLRDGSSGVDLPAAVIVETVQGEGGVNVARAAWLQGLERICRKHGILMILDEVQMGCGRTGNFLSFEESGISPDIITMSKSLGGYGLPMSVVLMKDRLDTWEPAEHNGTFRGNNLAFVAATAVLEEYWTEPGFSRGVRETGRFVYRRLREITGRYPGIPFEVRGRGMIWGIACDPIPSLAAAVSRAAFREGLVIETSGSKDHVLKVMPPLTIEQETLEEGLDMIERALAVAFEEPDLARARTMIEED